MSWGGLSIDILGIGVPYSGVEGVWGGLCELGFLATNAVLSLEVVKVVAVFSLEGLVFKELLRQYFGKGPDDFPVGWTEVRAKGQGYLEV